MSDIDITIGNARVMLYGEVRDVDPMLPTHLIGRNRVGASSEEFRVDDVLHATSRMMSAITDHEVDAIMQAGLTRLREMHRAASQGICGQDCGPKDHFHGNTCREFWINRGRQFSDVPTP